MPRLAIHLVFCLVTAAILSCSSHRSADEGGVPQDYPTLPGRFADEMESGPLIAREAYLGDENFYVSYEGVDGTVYAGGNWASRIDLGVVQENADGSYAGPYILPLAYRKHERWADMPATSIEPRLLSDSQWGRFRAQLFEAILPRTERAGIVMHFGNDDYFLFYNDDDQFESRLLLDKPAEFSIQERINFGDFMRRGLPQLEKFLHSESVAERRIVFSTGDTGAYSLPFLYVNLDLPIAVFVRLGGASGSRRAAEPGTRFLQSAAHVTQSHLGGLMIRPVSSLFRLMFIATDAAVETVRPTWLATLEQQPLPPLANNPGMDLASWEVSLDQLTGRSATRGTITYLIDGEEYFTRLIDALIAARESILIRTYIFDNDDFAKKVGTLLRRRSIEGVEVNILLDGLGTIIATGEQHESMPEDYTAPESVRMFLEKDSGINVRQVANPWLVAGDHVKTTIIDNSIAFTGGMNIGREYRYIWHDMMVEVEGPVVDVLNREFHDAWALAGPMGDVGYLLHKMKPDPELSTLGGDPMRVLFTRPGNAEIFRAQLAAIRNARQYIYIENAYFTDDAMLFELAKARRRGVDVRVILPLVGNHGPINRSNVLAANAMLEHGIRVFLYPGMSHIKVAVVDGWACFGSANWDKLSFRSNRELNLASSHPPVVKELLERVFEKDFSAAFELIEPFPRRWSDHLSEIFADYLL